MNTVDLKRKLVHVHGYMTRYVEVEDGDAGKNFYVHWDKPCYTINMSKAKYKDENNEECWVLYTSGSKLAQKFKLLPNGAEACRLIQSIPDKTPYDSLVSEFGFQTCPQGERIWV